MRLRPASRPRRTVATNCCNESWRSARSPIPRMVATKPVRPSVRRGEKIGEARTPAALPIFTRLLRQDIARVERHLDQGLLRIAFVLQTMIKRDADAPGPVWDGHVQLHAFLI